MKVSLIDYTGKGSTEENYAAKLLVYTKNTRLTQGEETRSKVSNMSKDELFKELSYISNTLRSSWEFVDYTFEISGVTRAFTHQLVRTRTASYAQQAQRVVDMSDFEVLCPDSVINSSVAEDKWHICIETIRNTYQELIEMGIPIEDSRGLLPTNILTNIIMKCNLRILSDLAGKRDNPRAQSEYVQVFRQMSSCVIETHPWTESFLYPERKQTPNLNLLLNMFDQAINSFGVEEINENKIPDLKEVYKEIDKLKGIWG